LLNKEFLTLPDPNEQSEGTVSVGLNVHDISLKFMKDVNSFFDIIGGRVVRKIPKMRQLSCVDVILSVLVGYLGCKICEL